mmetsp:Transcript_24846/g.68498  ORF Transcript_24846/g.68498 Transcript_24846/m.68498 type:complete len:103 (+) Transcript_24846:159-467(+)
MNQSTHTVLVAIMELKGKCPKPHSFLHCVALKDDIYYHQSRRPETKSKIRSKELIVEEESGGADGGDDAEASNSSYSVEVEEEQESSLEGDLHFDDIEDFLR